MRFCLRYLPLVMATAWLCVSTAARAENEGQDELNQATEKKLSAETLEDLGQVIELCESAMEKGLDPSNTEFAKNLLTSTLLQRAGISAKIIAEHAPPGWPQIRQRALGDLEKALKGDDKLAQAHLLIARLQALPPGDQEAALKAAERAVELSQDDAETQVAALVLQANLTEDTAKKLELFDRALKIAPQNNEALRYRGLNLLIAGKAEEALADLEAAVKADLDNPEGHATLGLALFMLQRNDEAIKAFSAAIKLAPESSLPYIQRARVYAQKKDNEKALDDLNEALKIDPDNVAALLLRARVHQQAGDAEAARADTDAALKDRPGLIPALELRAIISAGSGDVDQAIADLEELAKVAPKNPPLLSQLGLLYLADGQPRKAIEKYTVALAEDPQHFVSLRGRADAYLNIGKHAKAVADYEAAAKLQPEDTSILNNFAWVLATSPEDEVRDAKRSIELATEACKRTDYKQAHILSTLAAGYAEAGQWDQAVEWSKKAVALEPDDPDTTEQLKKELASYEAKKPWREKQEMKEEKPENQAPETPAEKDSSPPDPGRDRSD